MIHYEQGMGKYYDMMRRQESPGKEWKTAMGKDRPTRPANVRNATEQWKIRSRRIE
jgi:hypothetical protein